MSLYDLAVFSTHHRFLTCNELTEVRFDHFDKER